MDQRHYVAMLTGQYRHVTSFYQMGTGQYCHVTSFYPMGRTLQVKTRKKIIKASNKSYTAGNQYGRYCY
jgi:hypothetical protein